MEALRSDEWDEREASFDHGWDDFEVRPGERVALTCESEVEAARHFREVLSRYSSGITVVTGISAGQPVGFTCQSFASISLTPPLVMIAPSRSSTSWQRIHPTGRFCVNVLASDQQGLSQRFGTPSADKFADLDWQPAPATGSPLLDGVIGYVDCRIQAVHEAGDHLIVVGHVEDLGHAGEQGPQHGLTFYRGRYGTTGDHRES